MSINIVCGEPGSGKTSLLAALAVMSMTEQSLERLEQCNAKIDELNANGYNYKYAKKHVTYTNFFCRSDFVKWYDERIAYDLDITDFGLYDKEHFTKNVFPHAILFFMEGQTGLDSRKSKYFRASVSRAYENHRHWGLDIWIDAQRGTLIDLNVREISANIIEVQKLQLKKDRWGNIKKCIWHTRVFSFSGAYEQYLASGKVNGAYVTRTYVFNGDIFYCYESTNNFALFLDGREKQQFSSEWHKKPVFTKEYITQYNKKHAIDNQRQNNYWQKGVS